jgi:hypothetical protein
VLAAQLFLAYSLMRVFIVLGALLAIVVFWLVTPLIRLLASIPFTSRFRWWLFSRFEVGLFTGGFSDMESVLNNHVSATAIRLRLRNTLSKMRAEMTDDGVISVVVHSGGAPQTWELLSSDELAASGSPNHRFRLITVGAALNWARRGLRDRDATQIDRPLYGHDTSNKTAWLNAYSTWDPTPHGPIPVDARPYLIDGKPTWEPFVLTADEAAPNYVVRNLGAPVREEHREYWFNQEQVVPLLGYALDEDMEWSQQHVQTQWRTHWANVRLALVSTLVRVRLILLACALTIVLPFFHGDDVFQTWLEMPETFAENAKDVVRFRISVPVAGISLQKAFCADPDYRPAERVRARIVTQGNPDSSWATDRCVAAGKEGGNNNQVQDLLNYFSRHDFRGSAFAVAATLVLVYLVMVVFTELLWSQLARGSMPFGARSPQEPGEADFRTRPVFTFSFVMLAPAVISIGLFLVPLPDVIRWWLVLASLGIGLCEWFGLLFSIPAARAKVEAPTASAAARVAEEEAVWARLEAFRAGQSNASAVEKAEKAAKKARSKAESKSKWGAYSCNLGRASRPKK